MAGSILPIFKTPFYILRSAAAIFRSPRLFSLCLVPAVIGVLASLAGFFAAFVYRESLIQLLGLEPGSWYFALLGWLVFLLGCVLSALAGFISASLAGGYFVELIVERLLEQKQLHSGRQYDSIWQVLYSLLRALLNETILLSGILLCSVVAFALGFIPLLAFVPIVLGMLLAGFSLFNLPLAILEIPPGKRLTIVRAQLLPCIGLGACFTFILLIPFASVLLLPALYGAAIELLAQNTIMQTYLAAPQEKSTEDLPQEAGAPNNSA